MDDYSVPQNGGQYRSNIGEMSFSIGAAPNKPADEEPKRPTYSMPGILHFLQTEWARFEMERSQWDVERAELQARIAFLQGERKGQENLKQDLVRRIKMLEFALKQERAKFHKLKYGTDLCQGDMKSPIYVKDDKDDMLDGEVLNMTNSNTTWRQGRQLLRQYLQEIGYTDTIIDVRSARVRQLLGLQPLGGDSAAVTTSDASARAPAPLVNGDAPPTTAGALQGKRPSETQGHRTPNKKMPTSMAEGALMDSEASVLATFDFLAGEAVVDEDDDDDDNLSDGDEGTTDDDERLERKPKVTVVGNESMAGIEDIVASEDTEEALAEFDFLVSEGGEGGAGEARSQGDDADWVKKELSVNEEWGVDQQLIAKLKEQYKKERQKGKKGIGQRPKRSTLQAMLVNLESDDDMPALQTGSSSPPRGGSSDVDDTEETAVKPSKGGMPIVDDENLEAVFGLGDLADLTVNNEADPLSFSITSSEQAFRNTWNAKYTLRSHFDSVRALAFHPVEPVLITASEDHTLKLWNLQKTVPTKKTASLDVEPVYTFRAHTRPVLCLAISPLGEHCYSGGLDSTIRCWRLPNSNIDPYDSFDSSVVQDVLTAHTDAVWSLAVHRGAPSGSTKLLSCSADATIRLWDPTSTTPLLNTFTIHEESGLPTSVDFVCCETNQIVAAYTSANAYIYDIEMAKQVLCLESKQTTDCAVVGQINQVISHPTLPLSITAHEDRHIRFFDNNTGKMVHSMVAHLEAVTCLAIDPNGLYLLSGSHDSSIRLWNVDSKTCVQEITSHRKKFDESIHAVAFHPSEPFIASAGADALAKVFV